jgi:Phage tail assembly chaperone proteins, E, or 41 or 14
MADDDKPDDKPDKKVNGEDSGSVVVKLLRKNVIANGEEVSELTFREPTAADIERIGCPVQIDLLIDYAAGEKPKVSFDPKIMTQMMAMLATVPPSTIRQMHPRDWNNAAWLIAPFFMPDL